MAIIAQVLLYRNKGETKNTIFIINMLFVFLTSFIVFTSLPSNFIHQKILATAWSVMSVLAVVISLKTKDYIVLSKRMISLALIGSLVQSFL